MLYQQSWFQVQALRPSFSLGCLQGSKTGPQNLPAAEPPPSLAPSSHPIPACSILSSDGGEGASLSPTIWSSPEGTLQQPIFIGAAVWVHMEAGNRALVMFLHLLRMMSIQNSVGDRLTGPKDSREQQLGVTSAMGQTSTAIS